MALLDIFAGAVLPIVAISAVGFLLGRGKSTDPGPLNTLVVYVLAPALVFHSLATSSFSGETIAKMALGGAAYVVGMVVVAEAVARLLGETEPRRSALVLSATFANCGNYGIPLSDFAFPDGGRAAAVLFLAVHSVMTYTVGVYVASRAGGGGGLAGVKRVFRIPLVWAVPAAFAARALDVLPPVDSTPMTTLQLVGDASIPVMLVILGIQLSRTDYGAALSGAVVPTALKMGVAPVVGVGIALAVGFPDPTVARVYVLETAMPAAVTPVILVGEFAGDLRIGGVSIPEYVSTVVLVSTLVSLPLLTGLIAVLQGGALV
ncbi:AEC family transporter [Candidatus Halobonum tyrrellensis]|uniref:Permease n=1 Tax=Candidatus Halobonum tyrrellensis G22 TaxID=1324957 RepID=V4GQX9_9EURY|nr:AEC family transporter [Candidatus Halobonum tyrrellensis]ESP87456.1 permease [Candidatus Halobonum tyrrellensis G22]